MSHTTLVKAKIDVVCHIVHLLGPIPMSYTILVHPATGIVSLCWGHLGHILHRFVYQDKCSMYAST